MAQRTSTKIVVPELEASHGFYKAVKKSITHRAHRRQAGIYFSYAKIETNISSQEDQDRSDLSPPSPSSKNPLAPWQPSFKKWLIIVGCALTLLAALTWVYPFYIKHRTELYIMLVHTFCDFYERTRSVCESALEQARAQWNSLKAYDMDSYLKEYTESATQGVHQIRLWINTLADSLASNQDDDPHEIIEVALE